MENFKYILPLLLMLMITKAWSQMCTEDDRYTKASYFSSAQLDAQLNTTYGKAVNYLGKEQDLIMDIYFPSKKADKEKKRPFILLIHGGGFVGGQKEEFTYRSKEFAKRGFVSATMNYRLGFDYQINGEKAKAVYRTQQDVNQALNYIATHAKELRIDPKWVFLGGSSAGAITALYTGFGSQAEWNSVLPQFEAQLGPLKASAESQIQKIKIKGIYNMMGAIYPLVFASGELIPTVSFHGDLDEMVPIEASEFSGFGSKKIHEILSNAGVCNDLTIVKGGHHNIYLSKDGQDFMVDRVAKFYKSLFCNRCKSSKFIDESVKSENKLLTK